METKTFTSASASKFIKSLENEKELLLSREAENCTYVRAQGETEEPPEYDYAATRAAVDQIDEKVRRIRHAQHAFNATTEVPGEGMTVDEALVALAQMNAKPASVPPRQRSAWARAGATPRALSSTSTRTTKSSARPPTTPSSSSALPICS